MNMRILWFTNTPSLAEEVLGEESIAGGWIKSLEKELRKIPGIQLGVAFYSPKLISSFNTGTTTYFPILRPYNPIKELIKRYLGKEINIQKEADDCIKIINSFRPDIIHIHGTEFPFGSFLFNENFEIPTIISIQGNLTAICDKYFAGIDRTSALKYSGLKERLLKASVINIYKDFRKKSQIELKILNKCKFVIGRTEWDKRISSVLAPKSKYFYANEILRDRFYDNIWKQNKGKNLNILTVTSGGFFKGLETIIKAGLLLNDLSEFNYQWRIVGLSKNDSLVRLNFRYTRSEFGSQKIEFLGKLSEEKLINEFLKADIFVSASHIENSPNNICEAMILGLPIISTNVGGVSSLLTHNKEGILIPESDPLSLAGAIKYLNENYELALILGNNARERALARHNKNKIANSILSIYKEVLKSIGQQNLI